MHCPGDCKHLDEKKRICQKTGKRLAYAKGKIMGISFQCHEHEGVCEEAEEGKHEP